MERGVYIHIMGKRDAMLRHGSRLIFILVGCLTTILVLAPVICDLSSYCYTTTGTSTETSFLLCNWSYLLQIYDWVKVSDKTYISQVLCSKSCRSFSPAPQLCTWLLFLLLLYELALTSRKETNTWSKVLLMSIQESDALMNARVCRYILFSSALALSI